MNVTFSRFSILRVFICAGLLFILAGCYYVDDEPAGDCTETGCSDGEECVDGSCVPIEVGDECTLDEECAEGLVCTYGFCVTPPVEPECTVDADCAEGLTCQLGVCLTPPLTSCTTDEDCADGEKCEEGFCASSDGVDCLVDAECEDGEVCNEGACVDEDLVTTKIQEANPTIVFDQLVVGDVYALSAPVAESETDSTTDDEEETAEGDASDEDVVQAQSTEDGAICTCLWSVDPSGAFSFDAEDQCEVSATVVRIGQATLAVDVTCGGETTTHTQKTTAANPVVACADNDDCAAAEVCRDSVCVDRDGPVVELLNDQSRAPYIVSLDLRVEDIEGDPISSGLTESYFRVFEDGVEIDYAETGMFVTAQPDLPHSIVLVLDYTKSMETSGAIGDMIESAKLFVLNNLFTETHLIGIVEFHDRADYGSGYGTAVALTKADEQGKELIVAGIPEEGSVEAGLSRAWDAVQLAIDMLTEQDAQPGERRSIVFLTDGKDTTSSEDSESILSAAISDDIGLFPIGFTTTEAAAEQLSSLASGTGGSYFAAEDGAELRQAFRNIALDLRGHWNLRYITPSNDGTVELSVQFDWIDGAATLLHSIGAGQLSGDVRQGVIQVTDPAYDEQADETRFDLWADFMPRNVNQMRFGFARPDARFELAESNGLTSASNGWTTRESSRSSFELVGDAPLDFGAFGLLGSAIVPGDVDQLEILHDDSTLEILAQPKTISFAGESWLEPLTVSVTVDPPGAGFTGIGPDKLAYSVGEEVIFSAVAQGNYVFKNWAGNLSSTSDTASLVLAASAEVTAEFYPPRELTVHISPSGGGTVNISPSQADYMHGDVVTLTATPSTDHVFSQWKGASVSSDTTTTVTMTDDLLVTATFHPPHSLTIEIVGNGSVTKTPDKQTYVHGDVVTLEAVPGPGATFTAYSGDATGTGTTVQITMDDDKTVTATFK